MDMEMAAGRSGNTHKASARIGLESECCPLWHFYQVMLPEVMYDWLHGCLLTETALEMEVMQPGYPTSAPAQHSLKQTRLFCSSAHDTSQLHSMTISGSDIMNLPVQGNIKAALKHFPALRNLR